MKQKTLYISLTFIGLGILGLLRNVYYTNRYSYTTPDGSLVLNESLGLPIGMFMIVIGILFLVIFAVQYAVGYLKKPHSL